MKIVITPIAPLYENPDPCADLADEMLCGQTAELIEEQNGFCKVKTYYGYTGYVPKEHLIDAPEHTCADYLVSASTLDVMPTPAYRKMPLITLPRGSFLHIDPTAAEGNYVKAVLPDGREGYCVRWQVKKRLSPDYWKTHEAQIRASLVSTALKYLETPYRWGGKTPYGIDCSGLCSAVYLQHEMIIWRDAKLQSPLKPITMEQIKPGDLIFFPGHVAMYIGENRYIHSNQRHSGVCINSFQPYDPDYNERLLQTITGVGSIW